MRFPLNHVLGREANVRVLRAIFLSDIPIGVSELARLTRLQASGVARVCTRLEDLGVIEAVGRGSRYRQYRRASRFRLTSELTQLFMGEQMWSHEVMTEIRSAVSVGLPVQAAWLEGPVATETDRPEDTLVVGVLTDPATVETVRQDRWQRLIPIQSNRNLTIDLKVLTVADLKTASAKRRRDLERAIPIVGAPPLDLAIVSEPQIASRRVTEGRSHEQLDARASAIAAAIAERIRRDPSLIEEAQRFIERRLASASPGERLELEEWRFLLASMSVTRLCRFLTQNSERAARLRQSLPFLKVLSPEEREAIFAAASKKK